MQKEGLVVPLPEERIDSDSDINLSGDDLDEDDLELLQASKEDLQFLERLPRKEIDKSVSNVRKKVQLLRHGRDAEVKIASRSSSDEEVEGISEEEEESPMVTDEEVDDDNEVGEVWERGPRKVAPQQPKKESRKIGLPIKGIHGEMVDADGFIDEVLPLDPKSFTGVTIIDDGSKSIMEAEKLRIASEKQKKRKEEEVASERISKRKEGNRIDEAKEKAKTEGEEIFQTLDACRTSKDRREKAKMIMAKCAQTLLADPENQLRKQLPILLQLIGDIDATVAKYSMLSVLAIMKDLVPAYRIRPMHEREQEDVVLSKEVKKLWDYEVSLLKSYQSYLKLLLKAFKDQKSSKSSQSLSRAAAKCMSSMIISAPHFNYSSDILQVIVPGTANKDENIRKPCCDAISELVRSALQSADSGHAAVEATQLLADLVKRRKCVGLTPQVVGCLLDFTFPDIVSGEDLENAKKDRKKKKKKNRKKGKDEVDRAFKEAQAVVDKETRRNQQSAVLEALFEIFFRVLKTLTASLKGKNASSGVPQQAWSSARFTKRFPLVIPSLDGLARFSHLIR